MTDHIATLERIVTANGPVLTREEGDAIRAAIALMRGQSEVADLESDIDTLVDHNMALQQIIRDAIQVHREFNTTTDMADWLREALEDAATQAKPKDSADEQ